MKINLVCVGKIKEKYFTDAIAEYSKRLSRFCDFTIMEVDEASKITSLDKKIEAEGKMLLSACKGKIIALDGKGKKVSSEYLAQVINELKNRGVSEISFVVGGSNGLSSSVKEQACLTASFGDITFPHQLFRVVLAEQIYRAFTINAGLPYHK